MAKMTKVEGVQQVLRNLKRARVGQGRLLEVGLMRAGLFLQRKSQQVVPIDTGALRNSAFTRMQGSGLRAEVVVGYTQEYAIHVHENLEARHAPGKIAKYLEVPARRYRKQLQQIIADALAGMRKK